MSQSENARFVSKSIEWLPCPGPGVAISDDKYRIDAPLGKPVSAFARGWHRLVGSGAPCRLVFQGEGNHVGAIAVGIAEGVTPLTMRRARRHRLAPARKPVKCKGRKLASTGLPRTATTKPDAVRYPDGLKIICIIDEDPPPVRVRQRRRTSIWVPSAVRPWCFLDGPGVGSVEITEHYEEAAEPPATAVPAVPAVPTTQQVVDTAPEVTGSVDANRQSSERTAEDHESETSSELPSPAAWTQRAFEGLALQQAFGLEAGKEDQRSQSSSRVAVVAAIRMTVDEPFRIACATSRAGWPFSVVLY